MVIRFQLWRPRGFAGILFAVVFWGLVLGGANLRADTLYRVKYAISVGDPAKPVQLKEGDTVKVLSISGTRAVIMVTSPTGDTTVCQADSAAFEPVDSVAPAAVSTTAPVTSSPPAQTSSNPIGKSAAADLPNSVVLIKGDTAEGTGFLVRTAQGPAVVTNLHVISANPNFKITTTSGREIKVLSLQGATDRDVALFTIQDDHYPYLYLANDVATTTQLGDDLITPGNSEGGEVVLNTPGKLLGVGPVRVEISNPIYHGNSGGPVFDSKSGTVIGVVTQAMRVKTSNDIDQASHENKDSAISGTMRYFAMRLDNVPRWETYDVNRFLGETSFLKEFHQESRCLDSYMNGVHYEKMHLTNEDAESGEPDTRYYLRDDKIQAAQQNFHQLSTDVDQSEKLNAIRELVMQLQGVADDDMTTIQNTGAFYAFDQIRAREEIQYRTAIRGELDKFGDKISDMGH
jgi:hypothetical protein